MTIPFLNDQPINTPIVVSLDAQSSATGQSASSGTANTLPNHSSFYYMGDSFGVSAIAAQDLIERHDVMGHEVRVAVADSRIDWDGTLNNPNSDLLDNRGNYFDFDSHNYTVTSSQYTHGTLVAGFTQYIAPDVTIDSYDIVSGLDNGREVASAQSVLNAIYHAADNGVRVINISYSLMESYGTGGLSSAAAAAFQNAFNYAASEGTLVVFSAGNSSEEHFRTMDNVLVVGASNNQGNRAWFSSYGDNEVDIFAPGQGVGTMDIGGNGYSSVNGTSFAAPIVSGIAALLWSIDPHLTVDQIVERIMGSAQQTPGMAGLSIAEGIVNAEAALRVGTDGSEHLLSGDTDDELHAGGGADTVRGGGGNDTIYGGSGTDVISGGDGHDVLYGETPSNDVDDLSDTIYGGAGNDTIEGGYGNDELHGGAGNDLIGGGHGADTLIGNQGNDVLNGAGGADEMHGNAGNDFLNGGFGSDRLNGGSGADRFYHQGIADHGSDWIQDFTHSQGDRLVFGNGSANISQFQVNFANTDNAGLGDVAEAFIIYRPTEQIIWALVDGADEDSIILNIDGVGYDLLV